MNTNEIDKVADDRGDVYANSGVRQAPLFKETFEGADVIDTSIGAPSDTLKSFGAPFKSDSISKYLSRPSIIATGTISGPQGSLLWSTQVPKEVLSAGTGWSAKVAGYQGFRATTVLRLQVNANPFQQGRVVMAIYPQLQDKVSIYDSAFEYIQLPHVELDLSTDTEAILRLPHISALPYYNTSKFSGSVGIVKLFVYGAFAAGATAPSTCNYTIWAHFEDVELVIPQAQSGLIYLAQSGIAATEQKSRGPIALGLSKVSKTASLISNIPVLSSLASPVAWVSAIMSQVANVWGFSKPNDVDKFVRVIRHESGADANCDLIEPARSLGVFSAPSVKVDGTLFDTELDQMSISYLCTRWAYFTTLSFGATSTPGTNLANFVVCPTALYVSYDSVNLVKKGVTPLCYLGHMFAKYKGDIIYRFKFVKTQYHSGRIAILYSPGSTNGAPPTPSTYNDQVFRDIVDIRECTEYTFRVPYMNTQGYTPCLVPIGTVSIWVLDSLSAAENCPQSIDMLVEVCGAPDFEFACPIDTPGTGYMFPIIKDNPEYVAVAQMNPECFNDSYIGGAEIVKKEMTSPLCVGEHVLSLKQLLLRMSPTATVLGASSNPASSFEYFNWYLSAFQSFGKKTTTLPNNDGFAQDAWSVISALYNYSRGGVVVKFYQSDQISTPVFTRVYLQGTSYTADNTSIAFGMATDAASLAFMNSTVSCGFQGTIQPSYTNGLISVLVPQYSTTGMRLIAPVDATVETIAGGLTLPGQGTSQVNACPVFVHVLDVRLTGVSPVLMNIFRQAADDTHFGYFTYCPNVRLVQ